MIEPTDATFDGAFDAAIAITRRVGSLPRISGNAVMSQRVSVIHDDLLEKKRAAAGASSDPALPGLVSTFLAERLTALDDAMAAAYRCP